MEFRETRLPTGVRVVTETMPAVRSVSVGFWFAVGSRDEDDGQAGCSHFLEHLLFKGTERRSTRQIAEELDAVGGEMNAFTSKEYTCFFARVLDRDLPVAVDVVGDMLAGATNAPADVEAERQVVQEEINIHLDSPDDLVHSDFAVALLDRHPLAFETLGSMESIVDMDRDTIHAYYHERYRPERLVVAAAGNLDHDELVELVDREVGDLGRPGSGPRTRSAPEAFRHGHVAVRHRPTEQAHVLLGGEGFRQEDERRFPVRVLNTLLGGGMSSRLFQEVREERGLAYATYSFVSSYTDAGMYGAYAGTTPRRVDETLKVVREALDELPDSIGVEEVERAKSSLTGGMVLALEDTNSRMVRLGRMAVNENELLTVDEAIRRIEDVTPDDVRAVARELLATPPTLAVVGPFDEDHTERFEPYVA